MSVQIDGGSPPTSRASGWVIALLFIASVMIALLPIFSYSFLSLNDYLNHLARTAVLLRYHGSPRFSEFYHPNWQPLPNLAFDIWILVFGQVFSIEFAGKLFVATILTLLLSGVICLHRVTFYKWSFWPFLTLVFLYNRLLLSGLINFLFGVALWLHLFALWIYLRKRNAILRVVVLSIGALIVYFAHLCAFGILAVTLAVYELVHFASDDLRWPRRVGNLIVGAIPFLPALAIFVFFPPHGGATAVIKYRGLSSRLAAFAVPLLYDRLSDIIVYSILLAFCLWALASAAIRNSRPLIAAVIVLFVLQLCMPNVIMTAEGADHRIPIAIMLLAIAATNPKAASRGQCLGFALIVSAIFLFRVVTVEVRWSLDQPIYTDARAGLVSLPAGVRLASAFPFDAFDDSSAPAVALYYLPVWEVVPRGGFTQTLFAFATQQPLVLVPKYAALAAATPPAALWRAFVSNDNASCSPPSPALSTALRNYDFIVFLDRRKFLVCNNTHWRLFYHGRYLQIYELNFSRESE